MPGLLAQAGAQPNRQPKLTPIHMGRAQTGLITNRAALHDFAIGLYGKFYGAGADALLSGSNVEISPQQTWKHRPGTSSFATLPSQCLTVYPFFNPDGTITLYMDTATGIYITPSAPTLFASKASGALQTSFLQIGNTLYLADGVENRKIIGGKIYAWAINGPLTAPTVQIDSVGSSGTGSIPWSASTVFSTMGLLIDSNGAAQQLITVNADGTNPPPSTIGTSGVGEPVWNNTGGGTITEGSGLQWTCYGPVGLWVANSAYTDASGPGSLGAPAMIFDTGSGNLFIANGTGNSSTTRPNFAAVPLLGSTHADGAIHWFNVGPPQTWTPSHAYAKWGASFGANDNNAFIIEPTTPQAAGYGTINQQTVFLQVTATAAGTSDSSHTGPQWATSAANPVTRDGQLNYQFLGSATRQNTHAYTAWQAGTPSFSVINDGTNFQVCLVGGISAGSAPTFGTGYGTVTVDGTVQWVCVGITRTWIASTKWQLPASGFSPPVAHVNPVGGSSIIDSNGNVEFTVISGKSFTSPPTWPTVIGQQVQESGSPLVWRMTALGSTFKGSTPLAFTQGYGYTYAWKSRSATDFYVANAPNGQTGALGPPTGSGSGGITTAAPVFEMPVGTNAGAVMQVSGQWPTDTQYDTVVVYRSTDGFQNGPYLELTEIAAPTPINGVYQGTWTFFDSIPDIQLNELIEADTAGENAPPPAGLINIALHMNRIWGNVGNIVVASSGPDIPVGNGNGYEGWNASNTFPLKSPVNKNIPTQSGLLVFSMTDVYIIAGGPSIPQFFPWLIAQGIGLLSSNAIQQVGGEIYLVTADHRFIAFQPGVGHSEPGFPIADQITNFNPANVYVTEHAAGIDPSAMFVCDGSTGWFRLVPHATPGFLSPDQPVWSPFATITSGCTGAQSVTTSAGVRSLLIFQSSGVILKRDLSTAQDNGSNFSGNYTVGSIVVTHPSQLAELGFMTFEFANVGSPTVSYLPNEISTTGGATFQQFTSSVFDPPLLYGTTVTPSSYAPNRYYFKQTTNTNQLPPPLWCRHLQIKVNYPAENFFHELYSFAVVGALYAETGM